MRDPVVKVAVPEAAIAEAVRFLEARKSWLQPTTIDWLDVHLRAMAALRLGGVRLRTESGVVLEIRPEFELDLPADVRDLLRAEAIKLKALPRGRGRHQAGKYGPRNVAIAQAIEYIHQRHGFPRVRSEQPIVQPTSAAAVCLALKRLDVILSEPTVEDIWTKRSVLIRRNSAV
jgi:hypothetical protein